MARLADGCLRYLLAPAPCPPGAGSEGFPGEGNVDRPAGGSKPGGRGVGKVELPPAPPAGKTGASAFPGKGFAGKTGLGFGKVGGGSEDFCVDPGSVFAGSPTTLFPPFLEEEEEAETGFGRVRGGFLIELGFCEDAGGSGKIFPPLAEAEASFSFILVSSSFIKPAGTGGGALGPGKVLE